MKKVLLASMVLLLSTGCAFKQLETCDISKNGGSCLPVSEHLANSVDKGGVVINENPDIDKAVLADEYSRVAVHSTAPTPLKATNVRVRIYPYSDGGKFFDTRDVYVVIQRAGWSRGSYVYTPSGMISINSAPTKLPKQVIVNTAGLNLRVGASHLFDSKQVLKGGTKLNVSDYRGGWYKVSTLKGDTGWVNSYYVR